MAGNLIQRFGVNTMNTMTPTTMEQARVQIDAITQGLKLQYGISDLDAHKEIRRMSLEISKALKVIQTLGFDRR